ncbi:MAG: hypothetical protein EBU84_11740 [Actinobacteria bacterium]|nr:hypothetical protein [Actinomycetota bacterium]
MPNWFQKFQRNFVNASFKCEAQDEDEDEDEEDDEDEDEYERKSSAEALTMVRKEVEKTGKSMPSLANKHFALKISNGVAHAGHSPHTSCHPRRLC